ncbi:MAG TPA: hypothetical protein PKE54_20875, partial [Candidatus Obscuribacter sp.]|nr:hypothetical protein [Candidatus Obscuribacter sp.]
LINKDPDVAPTAGRNGGYLPPPLESPDHIVGTAGGGATAQDGNGSGIAASSSGGKESLVAEHEGDSVSPQQ